MHNVSRCFQALKFYQQLNLSIRYYSLKSHQIMSLFPHFFVIPCQLFGPTSYVHAQQLIPAFQTLSKACFQLDILQFKVAPNFGIFPHFFTYPLSLIWTHLICTCIQGVPKKKSFLGLQYNSHFEEFEQSKYGDFGVLSTSIT